jgi:putative transposase
MQDCATCGAPAFWCQARGEHRCRYHWPGTSFGSNSRLSSLQRERESALVESYRRDLDTHTRDDPSADRAGEKPRPFWRTFELMLALVFLGLVLLFVLILLLAGLVETKAPGGVSFQSLSPGSHDSPDCDPVGSEKRDCLKWDRLLACRFWIRGRQRSIGEPEMKAAKDNPPTTRPGIAEQVVLDGFQPVDPWKAPERSETKRKLPHLQTPESMYFVTFRCRQGLFLSERAKDIVMSAILYWDGARLDLDAAVVMPDHVHLIFRVLGGLSVSAVLQSIKGFSARSINRLLGRKGRFWLDESFDHDIRHRREFEEKIEYIRQNPVTRGLAPGWREYRWLGIKE